MASYESCAAHRSYLADCPQCRMVTSAWSAGKREGIALGEKLERERTIAWLHWQADGLIAYGRQDVAGYFRVACDGIHRGGHEPTERAEHLSAEAGKDKP